MRHYLNSGGIIFLYIYFPPRGVRAWFLNGVYKFNMFFRVVFRTFIACVAAGWIIFIAVDVGRNDPRNLVSLAGYSSFIVLLFVFSSNPAKVGVLHPLTVTFSLPFYQNGVHERGSCGSEWIPWRKVTIYLRRLETIISIPSCNISCIMTNVPWF